MFAYTQVRAMRNLVSCCRSASCTLIQAERHYLVFALFFVVVANQASAVYAAAPNIAWRILRDTEADLRPVFHALATSLHVGIVVVTKFTREGHGACYKYS